MSKTSTPVWSDKIETNKTIGISIWRNGDYNNFKIERSWKKEGNEEWQHKHVYIPEKDVEALIIKLKEGLDKINK